MKKLIICGSQRKNGRSMFLSKALELAYCKSDSSDSVTIFSLSEKRVKPCLNCEKCKDDYRCVVKDDMEELYQLLEDTDELTIVAPVFFASHCAQMKAVLDRLQPYFWQYLQEGKREKRTADLYIIGEGNDPHGFEPLVIPTRGAFALAGFAFRGIYVCLRLDDDELTAIAENPTSKRYESASKTSTSA